MVARARDRGERFYQLVEVIFHHRLVAERARAPRASQRDSGVAETISASFRLRQSILHHASFIVLERGSSTAMMRAFPTLCRNLQRWLRWRWDDGESSYTLCADRAAHFHAPLHILESPKAPVLCDRYAGMTCGSECGKPVLSIMLTEQIPMQCTCASQTMSRDFLHRSTSHHRYRNAPQSSSIRAVTRDPAKVRGHC